MHKQEVAGINFFFGSKGQLLTELRRRMQSGKKTWLTTPYSEFLYAALKDPYWASILNTADVAIPDGIGVFWARKFFSLAQPGPSVFAPIKVWLQAIGILLALLFDRQSFFGWRGADGAWVQAEKISGSDFVWDLAELAAREKLSVFLLGGFGDTPQLAADKLQTKFPDLRIVGAQPLNPDDPAALASVFIARPDILLVAFGPFRQEKWIYENLSQLPVKFVAGLGGTFDYLAGKRLAPPAFLRLRGLEWLWRLLTQPRRILRIWRATVGLVSASVNYRLASRLPFRSNVVSVIFNQRGEIFLGLRKPDGSGRNENHWMLPQGGLESGEDLAVAAKREVFEETGLTQVRYLKTSGKHNQYLWPLGFDKKYKGQKQGIVYFLHEDESEKPDLEAFHIPEFVDYKWVTPEKLLDTLHPLRRNLGEIVLQDISGLGIT